MSGDANHRTIGWVCRFPVVPDRSQPPVHVSDATLAMYLETQSEFCISEVRLCDGTTSSLATTTAGLGQAEFCAEAKEAERD